MSSLALPSARLSRARRWPARLQAPGVTCPPAILVAGPEATHLPPVTRQRLAGPLAMSLIGHAAVLAAGLAATLLLPSTPPAPAFSPPAFSIELAFAPTPTAHAPAEAAPPSPLAVPTATELAAVLADPTAPPAPMLEPPPIPARSVPAHPAARPAHPAKPAPAKPAPAKPDPAATAAPAASPADAAPMLIANPSFRVPPRPPVYPRRAIALRDQGEALIGAMLDPTGTPHEVRVLRSSGHPMLDRAALTAVGGWAFEPGRRAGQPVAARVEIPVRFTLR